MRFALIPVKELSQAKARLAPVLDETARRELVLAMFRDVLAAALACAALDGVAVVTTDSDLLAIAREAGAEGLPEPGGLNQALASASEKLQARGAGRLLILAADLPLATPTEIAAIAGASATVALVASRDGGTNALSLAPGAIPYRFGPDSAARHETAARAAGLAVRRLDPPGLAFDVDTPGDLRRLTETELPPGSETLTALTKIGRIVKNAPA